MIREKVKIITHSKEAILHVPQEPNLVMIECSQKLMEVVNNRLRTYTRKAHIIGDIDDILKHQEHETVQGNIIIVEQYSPIDDEDPLQFLVWQEDGTVLRHNDKPVWRLVYYTDDVREEDMILTRQYEQL